MPLSELILTTQAEGAVRVLCFFGVLMLCLGAEQVWPKRAVTAGWGRRMTNISLVILNTLLLRLLVPVLAVAMAVIAAEKGWGLLNLLAPPDWAGVIVAVLLLDMVIYWQHRLFHAVPLFWRLHRVHHSDVHIDATTGLRFHPLEILLSMAIKLAAVILIGASPLAVLVFEVLLNAGSVFNHSNLRLPPGADRWLRLLVVTPDMHRVHHSWRREETDSNFGFSFPWWDRLFCSYRAQPMDGHNGMTIGLHSFREAPSQRLLPLLWQPLRNEQAAAYD